MGKTAPYLENEPNFISLGIALLTIDAVEIRQIWMIAIVPQNAILFVNYILLFSLKRLYLNCDGLIIGLRVSRFHHLLENRKRIHSNERLRIAVDLLWPRRRSQSHRPAQIGRLAQATSRTLNSCLACFLSPCSRATMEFTTRHVRRQNTIELEERQR